MPALRLHVLVQAPAEAAASIAAPRSPTHVATTGTAQSQTSGNPSPLRTRTAGLAVGTDDDAPHPHRAPGFVVIKWRRRAVQNGWGLGMRRAAGQPDVDRQCQAAQDAHRPNAGHPAAVGDRRTLVYVRYALRYRLLPLTYGPREMDHEPPSTSFSTNSKRGDFQYSQVVYALLPPFYFFCRNRGSLFGCEFGIAASKPSVAARKPPF